MNERKVAVTLAAVGMMAVGLASCSSSDPATLSLTVNETGVDGLPASTDAGLYEVTVQNDGADDLELELIESAGRPEDEFLANLTALVEGAPWPDYINAVAGVGIVAPGATLTTTMTLAPAQYSLVNTLPEVPVVLGTVEATGDAPDTKELPSDASIIARDYTFDVEGIEAGTQSVTFRNEGPSQVHHAVVLAYPAGTDEAAVRESLPALLTAEEGGAPPDGIPLPDESTEISSAVYSSGNGGTFEAEFESGRTYAVLCFISDRQGSAPHAIAYDMFDVFTVE